MSSFPSSGGGGGSGKVLQETFTQIAHGFNVLDAIYHNGTDWQLAKADSATTASIGVITEVPTANTFIITYSGSVTITAHGMTAGEYFWLSETTAGALTYTAPTTGIVQSIGKVIDANNILFFYDQAEDALAGLVDTVVLPTASVPIPVSTDTDVMSFTIPSSGTWEIGYTMLSYRGSGTSGRTFWVTDTSNNPIANSSTGEYQGSGTIDFGMTHAKSFTVTTSGSQTFKVRAYASSNTFDVYRQTSSVYGSGSGGSVNLSGVTYKKISGFTPTSGQTVDYVSGRLAATQTTNLTASDHVKFDTVLSGNIPLDTTTPYTNTPGADSIGRITLTAGKTYELTATVGEFNTSSQNNISLQWYDVTTGTPVALGVGTALENLNATTYMQKNSVAQAVFTPTVNSKVELRLNTNVITSIVATANYGTSFVIKQLGTTATTLNTRAYVRAGNTSGQSIPDNTTTTVTNWTEASDTTGSFDATTGIFTAPRTGFYAVNLKLLYGSQAWVGNNLNRLYVDVSGTSAASYEVSTIAAPSTGTYFFENKGSATVEMTAGDTLVVRTNQLSGASRTLANGGNDNSLTIIEVPMTF